MKKKSTYKATPKAKQTAKARAATPKPKAKATAAKTVAKTQGAKKPLAKQQNMKKAPNSKGAKSIITKQNAATQKNKPEIFPHFRYYRKSEHPALITGEQPIEEYKYRKVMHGEYDGKRLNEEVNPNPDLSDKKPMYIGKRTRHDKKSNFEPNILPWKYPNKDKKK